MSDQMKRVVCNFSCGAASAVATKLALAQYGGAYDVRIVNAYIEEEHPDNRRFLDDCERWFGHPVTVLRDEKWNASTIEVFRRERFMNGPYGAACTTRLKRRVLDAWSQPGDVLVLGFTSEEAGRFDDFLERNPQRPAMAPLIERGLGKDDCKAMIERAGIALPIMYSMGYDNANCIGCVKGGKGYFRAIREDFPAQFETLAAIQDELGEGSFFHYDPSTKTRISLRELGDGPIRRNERLPSCSFFCELAEKELEQ